MHGALCSVQVRCSKGNNESKIQSIKQSTNMQRQRLHTYCPQAKLILKGEWKEGEGKDGDHDGWKVVKVKETAKVKVKLVE